MTVSKEWIDFWEKVIPELTVLQIEIGRGQWSTTQAFVRLITILIRGAKSTLPSKEDGGKEKVKKDGE